MNVSLETIPLVTMTLSVLCCLVACAFRYSVAERDDRWELQSDRNSWRHPALDTIAPIEPTQPWSRPAQRPRVAGCDTSSVYAPGKDGGTGNGTAWLIKSGAITRLPIAAIPPALQGSRWVNAIVVSDAVPEQTGVGITATRKAYRAPALPAATRSARAARIAPPASRSNLALRNQLEW